VCGSLRFCFQRHTHRVPPLPFPPPSRLCSVPDPPPPLPLPASVSIVLYTSDGAHAAAGTGSGSSGSGPPSKQASKWWRQPHQPQPLARLTRPPTSWMGAAAQSDPHPDSPPPHVNTDQRQARIVRSSLSCRRMDAWGDVCVYRNVCFPLGAQEPDRPDGGMRFFWGPEGNTAGYRAPFPLGDVQTGYVAPRTERVGARAETRRCHCSSRPGRPAAYY
jgi:hypothetical protein